MPTLHLLVCAGFANRVRALVSGLCFAEQMNIPLVIHWVSTSAVCYCKFQSVLDPESLPKTIKVSGEDIFQTEEVNTQNHMLKLFYHWDKKSDIRIRSCEAFYRTENWEKHLRNLRPSRFVKELLTRRCGNVDWSKATGVHIRRTDNFQAIQKSPLESFLVKMRENKESFYVICTDDQSVRDQLQIEFSNRCCFPSVVLLRKSEEGMIHAVTDFFALSKCVRILGSAHSSFSEIAANYGNVELEIA